MLWFSSIPTVHQNKKSGSLKWCAPVETNTQIQEIELQTSWYLSSISVLKCKKNEASLHRLPALWALHRVLHRLPAETFPCLYGSSTEFTPAVHHPRKNIIPHVLLFLFTETAVTSVADLMKNRLSQFFFLPHLRSRKGLWEGELSSSCGLYISAADDL